jgi:hypothetical protein
MRLLKIKIRDYKTEQFSVEKNVLFFLGCIIANFKKGRLSEVMKNISPIINSIYLAPEQR